jgi:hypothetical protein
MVVCMYVDSGAKLRYFDAFLSFVRSGRVGQEWRRRKCCSTRRGHPASHATTLPENWTRKFAANYRHLQCCHQCLGAVEREDCSCSGRANPAVDAEITSEFEFKYPTGQVHLQHRYVKSSTTFKEKPECCQIRTKDKHL